MPKSTQSFKISKFILTKIKMKLKILSETINNVYEPGTYKDKQTCVYRTIKSVGIHLQYYI